MIHADYDSHNGDFTGETQQAAQPAPSPSKLTLVLPPLQSGKLKVPGGKAKNKPKGPPRPAKLKPLKEVLSRLIAQIKKKDDYAFFLQPVDVSQVPGYSDVIKRPMDLGTISTKVNRGKYRSLEEFTADIKLVTANAKAFNPPGTIYHTEAERIEAYALDQITKSASIVIEYETDWTVNVDGDDADLNIEDDDDVEPDTAAPGSPIGPEGRSTRSPSFADLAWGRRPPQRAAVRKAAEKDFQQQQQQQQQQVKLPDKPSEKAPLPTLDEEGHMPGYRDGVGRFPPDSDWAPVMLALKLKDKKYRTKKERLRIEKEGLPMCPDGSLNYFEIEDPFTKLETLIPDPPITAPQVTPLVPPTALSEPSQITLPAPSSLFITDDTHSLSSIVPPPPAPPADGTTKRRKYFTINRFVPARGAAPKPAGDTASPAPSQVEWQTPRTAHPTDYGIYASLMGRLASESRVTLAHAVSALGTEERLFAFLRASMDIEPPLRSSSSKAAATSPTEESSTPPAPEDEAAAYFTGSRAREGAAYIRDIVYGGFDGLAYARSVAQFVDGSNTPHEGGPTTEPHPLGASLAQWAFENVVDPLTSGRLRLLRDTAHALLYPESKANPLSSTWQAQIVESSAEYPHRAVLLGALKAVLADKIDAAALVRSPEELLRSVGVGGKRKRDPSEDVGSRKKPKDEGGPGEDVADTKTVPEEVPDFDLSTFAAVQVALRKTGDALLRLDRQQREEQKVKSEEDSARIEDPAARTVRLQLLNIVKAVPVDFIGTNGLVIPAS